MAWLTILAILTGPLAALLIQKYIEEQRAKKDRKVRIFRDLMANRAEASRIAPPFVHALNGIETEFYGDTKIIEAWRILVNHLYTERGSDSATRTAWDNRVTQLLSNMLSEMAELLGYHFDEVTLQRNIYYPIGWNLVETENTKLRQAAVKVFEGEKPLKVELTNEAVSAAARPTITPIQADPKQFPRDRQS